MFTKMHYDAVAQALKRRVDLTSLDYSPDDSEGGADVHELLTTIVSDLADLFERDNPKFQRDKFLKAAGVK